ncbi:MAG: BolA family protein [Kiloniellaceae bacterium]
MSVQERIGAKLTSSLAPAHLEVVNESHMHSVPPGSETHFKVVVVSDRFEGVPLVRRHRTVNAILQEELRERVHALSLQTLTAAEWARRDGQTMASPACRGGSKADE